MALSSCDCIKEQKPEEVQKSIYCALLAILAASGGDIGTDEYISNPSIVTTGGTIPVGALGWSIAALSGTITVNGTTLPVGGSLSGGGYGGRILKTAIAYTVTGGSAAITYDIPG